MSYLDGTGLPIEDIPAQFIYKKDAFRLSMTLAAITWATESGIAAGLGACMLAGSDTFAGYPVPLFAFLVGCTGGALLSTILHPILILSQGALDQIGAGVWSRLACFLLSAPVKATTATLIATSVLPSFMKLPTEEPSDSARWPVYGMLGGATVSLFYTAHNLLMRCTKSERLGDPEFRSISIG